MVTAYWKNKVMDPARGKGIERIEKKFHDLVTALDLTDKERLVLGKFISLRSQMSFDSGLRIGLTAHAQANDKAVTRT
jgi:hypothetical protein